MLSVLLEIRSSGSRGSRYFLCAFGAGSRTTVPQPQIHLAICQKYPHHHELRLPDARVSHALTRSTFLNESDNVVSKYASLARWFDIPTLANLTSESRRMDDEPGLMKSVDSLDQLIAQEIESSEIPEESIVIGGFSQGSVISLLTGITSKRKLAGVVALSGWVPLNHKIAEVS
jgi:predicted esterase